MEIFEKIKKASLDKLKEIEEQGIQQGNLEMLDKLVDVYKDIEEVENMRYNEYGYSGRGPSGGAYGEYREYGEGYGRRGRDRKYRGDSYMERMQGEYGRYEEGRRNYNEGNYGAKDDTLKSLKYMLEATVDFFRMLKQDANSPEEMELVREYTRQISEM